VTVRARLRRLACALAAAAVVVAPVLSAVPAQAEEPKPKRLFTIDDSRIDESSDLARSGTHDDIWWTSNDSGDTARIFALDKTGQVLAEVTFDAQVRDVEAIGIGTNKRIYVGDIGDNLSNRDTITVYSLPEPEELRDQRVTARAYKFKYPDGPHNAEALLVNPQTNRLYVVTKEAPTGAIYEAPTPDEMSRTDVNDLTKLGTAPAIITDGTFTPNGRRVLLRSVNSMTVLSWPAMKQLATAPLPLQVVGESLAMGPDDDSVLFGSEGKNSPVYQLAIPAATKAQSGESPGPASSSGSAGSQDTKQSHTMRWTLIGAGAFAVLMAMFTFPRGRRERADAMLERQQRQQRHRSRPV
jgi:hypothetical protein